jgi:hypothetical protein
VFDPDFWTATREDKAGLGCSAIAGPLTLAIHLGRLDRAMWIVSGKRRTTVALRFY